MQFYPNGNKKEYVSNFSIFLYLISGPEDFNISYTFSLLKKDQTDMFKFGPITNATFSNLKTIGWGLPNFLAHKKLLDYDDRWLDNPNESFKIACKVIFIISCNYLQF